ncbi:MAG: sulfotransferase [Pseudomonadota bacterium]
MTSQQFAKTLRMAIEALNANQPEQAVRLSRQCLKLMPDNPDAHLVAGACLSRMGQPAEAIQHLRIVTAGRPDNFSAFSNLGICLMQTRSYRSAAEAFRRAADLQPASASAVHNLACALAASGEYAASLPYFEQAAGTPGGKSAKLFRDHASALEKLSRYGDARELYLAALQLNPDFALAHRRLGHIYQLEGKFDKSESHLRKVLDLGQEPPEVYQMLALMERLTDRDVSRASLLLQADGLDGLKSEALHAALGRHYERSGDFDQAFEQFRAANKLRARTVRYDPEKHRNLVSGILEAYSRSWFQAGSPAGCEAKLVFIVGMPRSGSTLVHQILASHPMVLGAGETGLVEKALGGAEGGELNAAGWEDAQLRQFAESCVAELAERHDVANVLIDKSLRNIHSVGLLSRAFPHARFVYCSREPLDICISCFAASLPDGQAFALSMEHIAHRQLQTERLAEHWRRMIPDTFHLLKYENLIHAPEQSVRDLLEELELPWNSKCMAFTETESHVDTSSVYQVRQPIYSSSVGRWRNFKPYLVEAAETLAPISSAAAEFSA